MIDPVEFLEMLLTFGHSHMHSTLKAQVLPGTVHTWVIKTPPKIIEPVHYIACALEVLTAL